MPDGKKENILDIMAKGATSYIKTKTKMKQDELKMGSALMLKQIEQRMNPQFQMQKMMAEQYRGQMGGGGRRPLETDTQRFMTTPRVRYKGGRFERGVPETRGIYNYLLRKKKEQPKKFDKEDETMLQSLGQKLGFAKKGKEEEELLFTGPGGEPSKFDPQVTEEVFVDLFRSGKSDADFQEDLKDLRKHRKTYEERGVDVVQVLRRAHTAVWKMKGTDAQKKEKVGLIRSILDWVGERY